MAIEAKEKSEIALKAEMESRTKAFERDEKAKAIEREAERSKTNYKSLFRGQMIFTIALALFLALNKLETVKIMFQWIPSRGRNIKSFVLWSAGTYSAATHFINEKWDLGNWSYVFTALITFGIGIGLFFLFHMLFCKAKKYREKIRSRYWDRVFKDFVSSDIVLISLFIALFFGQAIESFIKLNPTSLWLILSVVGIILWHLPEIKDKVPKRYY